MASLLDNITWNSLTGAPARFAAVTRLQSPAGIIEWRRSGAVGAGRHIFLEPMRRGELHTGTPMQTPTTHPTAAPIFRAARHPAPLGLAGPPSFARALRQRGLIAPAPVAGAVPEAAPSDAPDGPGQWIAVRSAFEVHVRRQAMEQAFAELRGDAA
ncbi:MAG TPA: hypothetical protein VMT49_08435 [Steroidobacteraceae bacterium]|nr:hypothetical protein [Steroidobacteraceae bacterium]